MSVYCFTGTPGTGKSAHVARMIRDELNGRSPRPVIANFEINPEVVRHPEMFTYVDNDTLTTDWLSDFAEGWWSGHSFREGGILLFVDECQ